MYGADWKVREHQLGDGIYVGDKHVNAQLCSKLIACRDVGRAIELLRRELCIPSHEARKLIEILKGAV